MLLKMHLRSKAEGNEQSHDLTCPFLLRNVSKKKKKHSSIFCSSPPITLGLRGKLASIPAVTWQVTGCRSI